MKLLIDDIIREDPKLVKNQANIKRKLKERLKKSNKYSAYVLEEDNIKNLIRSWVYAHKQENDHTTPKDVKIKLGKTKFDRTKRYNTDTANNTPNSKFDKITQDFNSQSTKVDSNLLKFPSQFEEIHSEKVIIAHDRLAKPSWMRDSSSEDLQNDFERIFT